MLAQKGIILLLVTILVAGCSGKKVRFFQNEASRMYCEKVGSCEKRREPYPLSNFDQYTSQREAIIKRDMSIHDDMGINPWKEDEWLTPLGKAEAFPVTVFPVK